MHALRPGLESFIAPSLAGDHLLPISKADMWSLWVGRCLHTLVTCIAQPKSDPRWGRYLVKFRSHGHGISGRCEGMK